MARAFKPKKYEVCGTGSGWGVWCIETNQKVEAFGNSKSDRLRAVEHMCFLNGRATPTNGFK